MGKRHKPEEVIAELRQVDVMPSQGTTVADAVRSIGVTEVTYHRWRQGDGGQCQRKPVEPGKGPAGLPGMTQRSPFRYLETSPEVIRLAAMLYIRFPLALRNVEELLHERGIEVSHETVRFWWQRLGPLLAAEIQRLRAQAAKSVSRSLRHLPQRRFDAGLVRSAIYLC